MKASLLLCLSVLCILGCEDDKGVAITDGAIYSELTVRYDMTTNFTYGTVSLWEGSKTGRPVIFNGGATVKFQDLIMEYRTGVGYSYSKEVKGFQTPATFSFGDINKKTFTNSISFNTIDFHPSDDLDTIDISQPLTLIWSGTPLVNNESATLRIGSISALQDSIGGTAVRFSVNQLSLLASSKGTTVPISLERSRVNSLQENLGGGGFIRAEYISKSKSVYIK